MCISTQVQQATKEIQRGKRPQQQKRYVMCNVSLFRQNKLPCRRAFLDQHMVSVKTYFTVGRDPKTFKFYDEFEEQLAKLDSAEIDVQVDESGQ